MNVKQLSIGSVKLLSPVILGPMAGVTDLSFCLLCREMGAGLVCMEMVSAKGLHYHNKNTEEMIMTDERVHPVSLQLFGSEPDILAEAVEMLEERPFDIIDFNMGCPVNKVVRNQEGSALMKDPALAGKIVKAMVRSTRKPVTVKIRKGFDETQINAVETAKMLEDAGASAITVHGRTRDQFYSGNADWSIIQAVKEAVSIPVIGNGDADSPEKVKQMMDATECDGVMISRAARGNPWIFREVSNYMESGVSSGKPDVPEVVEMIRRHAAMMSQNKGEYIAMRELRSHIGWYSAGFPHASQIRRQASLIESFEDLEKLLKDWQRMSRELDGTSILKHR